MENSFILAFVDGADSFSKPYNVCRRPIIIKVKLKVVGQVDLRVRYRTSRETEETEEVAK